MTVSSQASKSGPPPDMNKQGVSIPPVPQQNPSIDEERIFRLVHDLSVPELSEQALSELSRHRENFPDLAIVIWYSYGTITSLLHEIISVYQFLHPPTLTAIASTKVCNCLALLQCVASHPQTRRPFLNAQIPLYLYPFLNTASKSRPLEYLRLTCLGVIGALVKTDDPMAMAFLLDTEIIPLCLRIMETGSDISKTVAIFIVQKILLDDRGLSYVCETANRFYTVATVLSNMANASVEAPSRRLLKHIIRCYLRLTDNPRAREALTKCLPQVLRKIDPAFYPCIKEEPTLKKWLLQLICNTEPTNNNNNAASNNSNVGNTNNNNHQGISIQQANFPQHSHKQQMKNQLRVSGHSPGQPEISKFASPQAVGQQLSQSHHKSSNLHQANPNFNIGTLTKSTATESRHKK